MKCEMEFLGCFLLAQILYFYILREAKASRKIGKWQWETSIAYSSLTLGDIT